MHLPKPDGQPGVYATVRRPAHLNGLRGISVDGNSQPLPRLGRVGRNIERFDGDNVVGVPYIRFSPLHLERENLHTADRVAPTGRRANIVSDDNLLRSWWSSKGNTGESEGQERNEG